MEQIKILFRSFDLIFLIAELLLSEREKREIYMKERSEDVATTNILVNREEPESVHLLSPLLNTRILSSLLLIIANVNFYMFFFVQVLDVS